MKFTLLLCVLVCCTLGFSHTSEVNSDIKIYKNRREKYPVGINLVGVGPSGLFGVSMDWFITSKLNLDGGVGLEGMTYDHLNYFVGLKYYLRGKSLLNTGLYLGVYDMLTPSYGAYLNSLYVPFGIHRISKRKVSISAEVAGVYHLNDGQVSFGAGLKLGWRFNRFKRKKSQLNLK